MKTIDEILTPYFPQTHEGFEEWIDYDKARLVMLEYAVEVLKEAANRVEIMKNQVTKKSILAIINELK